MRLLLDTHCWLWHLAEPVRLGTTARAAIADDENEIFLSAASVWEIVTKHAIGKLRLPEPPETYVRTRQIATSIRSLPITDEHALRVSALPSLHRDPFDRIIIAQALVEGLTFVTADHIAASYDVPLLWAGHGQP